MKRLLTNLFSSTSRDLQPNRTKTAPRILTLESLEARQLMAGGITASVSNGNLTISEASGQANLDNGVRVSRLTNGKIRVEGTESANFGTAKSMVDGLPSRDFTVTGSLFINLAGGNDLVQIGFDDGSGVPTFTDIRINAGTPPQTITRTATFGPLQLTSFTTLAGPDNDQVIVWAAATRGSVSIDTGPGEDFAFLGAVDIGDFSGVDKLTVNTGTSNDQVTLIGASVHGDIDIQTYTSVSESGSDGVYFDQNLFSGRKMVVDGNTNVRMGGGDDSFFVTDSADLAIPDELYPFPALKTQGSLVVDTGAGNDYAFARAVLIGDLASGAVDDVGFDNFVLKMGAGSDEVLMHNIAVAAFVDIQMYDSLSETDVDKATIESLFAGVDMTIRTGGGNDTVRVDEATVMRDLNIDVAAGDDRVDLVDHVLALHVHATLTGGDGFDRLTKSIGTSLNSLVQTGWENINGLPSFSLANTVLVRR